MSVLCEVNRFVVVEDNAVPLTMTGQDRVEIDPFLATKFNIPQTRLHLVSRPHLTEILYDSIIRRHKLTLVCAPAGFGKTTLLSSWVNQTVAKTSLVTCQSMQGDHPHPSIKFTWVSLDEGDDNLVRFWSVIISALQKLNSHIGLDAISALKSPNPPSLETILTVLINDITHTLMQDTDTLNPAQSVLLIDDYHLINNAEIHKGIAFFIANLPQSSHGIHIVISTRVEPPITLNKLRVRAQISEVRANDLRFSYEETATFFNEVMEFHLHPDQIAAMETRTEGWIAGLQLAALTMQSLSDVNTGDRVHFADFINAFTGSNRYVLDYLGEEILARQPENVQQFLIKTSILNQMTGILCDAVLETSDSVDMLHLLDQTNLFILSLDQNRMWYRYHRLFKEFLLARLQRSSLSSGTSFNGTCIQDLYSRASMWCERHGMLNEAVNYALDGHLYNEAAVLIGNAARTLLMQGEAGLLLTWLNAIPEQLIESRTKLYITRLWAYVITGQLDTAKLQVERLNAIFPAHDDCHKGEIAAIKGFIYILEGDVSDGISYAQKAMDHLEEDDAFLRGLVALNLGRAYDIIGDVESANAAYIEAHTLGQSTDNYLVSLVALSQLGDIKLLQGCLGQAADLYMQALNLTKQSGGQQPLVGLAYAGLGIVHYERNELDKAESYLLDGVGLGQLWENTDVLIYCMVHLAWVRYAQSNTAKVSDLCSEITTALEGQIVSQPTISFAHAHLTRLRLRLGDSYETHKWLSCYSHETVTIPNDLAHTQLVTWAQISLSKGNSGEVIELLVPEIARVKDKGLVHYEIELMTLLSMAYFVSGRIALAQEIMGSARRLGSQEKYFRVYIDCGTLYGQRSNEFGNSVIPAYSANRLRANSKCEMHKNLPVRYGTKYKSNHTHMPMYLNPLSSREQEILKLLSTGLSNKEIALSLYIAVGTVKQHLKNIYSKFEVHNRTEAVHFGQTLGII